MTSRGRREYDDWHRDVAAAEGAGGRTWHPWHAAVARLAPDLAGKSVLEVGCGRGDFAIWLARENPGSAVSAVDFSPAAIDIASRRASALGVPVQFKAADAQALTFPDQSFDCVISCECLEHVERPRAMLAEIHRVLRPGGTFIVTTENYANGMLLAWAKTWLLGIPFDSGSGVQPRENFFVFWRVLHMIRRSGLRVRHWESSGFQWLLLPRVNPAKLATVDFTNRAAKQLLRPFGRHVTFCGVRPEGGA